MNEVITSPVGSPEEAVTIRTRVMNWAIAGCLALMWVIGGNTAISLATSGDLYVSHAISLGEITAAIFFGGVLIGILFPGIGCFGLARSGSVQRRTLGIALGILILLRPSDLWVYVTLLYLFANALTHDDALERSRKEELTRQPTAKVVQRVFEKVRPIASRLRDGLAAIVLASLTLALLASLVRIDEHVRFADFAARPSCQKIASGYQPDWVKESSVVLWGETIFGNDVARIEGANGQVALIHGECVMQKPSPEVARRRDECRKSIGATADAGARSPADWLVERFILLMFPMLEDVRNDLRCEQIEFDRYLRERKSSGNS